MQLNDVLHLFRRSIGVWFFVGLNVCCLVLCVAAIVVVRTQRDTETLGVRLVKAMYEFSTPRELVSNQQVVKELLVPEEWERLRMDDDRRVVNAYFKFRYAPSEVIVCWERNGWVCYHLRNENIKESTHYLLKYAVDDASGLIYDVAEYEIILARGSVDLVEF